MAVQVTLDRNNVTTVSDEAIENTNPGFGSGLGVSVGYDLLGGDGLSDSLSFGVDRLGAPPEFGIPPNIDGEPGAAPGAIPELKLPGLDGSGPDGFHNPRAACPLNDLSFQ